MAWAKDMPQGKDIELLSKALARKGGSIRGAGHRLIYIALFFSVIAFFMWFKSRA